MSFELVNSDNNKFKLKKTTKSLGEAGKKKKIPLRARRGIEKGRSELYESRMYNPTLIIEMFREYIDKPYNVNLFYKHELPKTYNTIGYMMMRPYRESWSQIQKQQALDHQELIYSKLQSKYKYLLEELDLNKIHYDSFITD